MNPPHPTQQSKTFSPSVGYFVGINPDDLYKQHPLVETAKIYRVEPWRTNIAILQRWLGTFNIHGVLDYSYVCDIYTSVERFECEANILLKCRTESTLNAVNRRIQEFYDLSCPIRTIGHRSLWTDGLYFIVTAERSPDDMVPLPVPDPTYARVIRSNCNISARVG